MLLPFSVETYMDDSIHSCSTPKKAIDTIKELGRVLDTGSFKIKEWLSSPKEKLTHESVRVTQRALSIWMERKESKRYAPDGIHKAMSLASE